MKIVQRNVIIGILTSFAVLNATGASALDWLETPKVVGVIVGSGIGGAIGSASPNPFVAGATGAAGGYVGGIVGPYIAENPKKSVEIYSVVTAGPIGILTFGTRVGISAAWSLAVKLF